MKRILLILAAVFAVTLPILVIAQSKAQRDSSAAKPLERERARQRYFELQKEAAEQEKLAAEKARIKAKRHGRMHLANEDWDFDELAEIEPAIEEAMSQVEPALEQAREALENIDLVEINAAVQEASESLARIAPFAPIPDIPPIPAIAPVPHIPPIPDIPPMPEIWMGEGMSFGRGWGFSGNAYSKYLSDDNQVHLQALASLLNRDEEAALPEIKKLAREHENWAMRVSAVAMLANSENSEVIPILEEVLNKDTDQRVRKAAVRALSHRDEPEAREVLKRLLMK